MIKLLVKLNQLKNNTSGQSRKIKHMSIQEKKQISHLDLSSILFHPSSDQNVPMESQKF